MRRSSVRTAALLIAVAICIDLAGLDCRQLVRAEQAAVSLGVGSTGSGAGEIDAGADCLCCSTFDLAARPRVPEHPDGSTPLMTRARTCQAAGDLRPPYRPPIS